jgi:hypothetical protein
MKILRSIHYVHQRPYDPRSTAVNESERNVTLTKIRCAHQAINGHRSRICLPNLGRPFNKRRQRALNGRDSARTDHGGAIAARRTPALNLCLPCEQHICTAESSVIQMMVFIPCREVSPALPTLNGGMEAKSIAGEKFWEPEPLILPRKHVGPSLHRTEAPRVRGGTRDSGERMEETPR